jgi:hypothetical protein
MRYNLDFFSPQLSALVMRVKMCYVIPFLLLPYKDFFQTHLDDVIGDESM